ncbi:MAG: hypothetical protein M1151_06820 [Candidatus Thermoplasmatota archaeon]|nr:hypothetical protein [Candidatus Thermoplasmatota archaeon]
MSPVISISLQTARRLAVSKQHLSGKMPAKATGDTMVPLLRDIAYVQ